MMTLLPLSRTGTAWCSWVGVCKMRRGRWEPGGTRCDTISEAALLGMHHARASTENACVVTGLEHGPTPKLEGAFNAASEVLRTDERPVGVADAATHLEGIRLLGITDHRHRLGQ